MNVTTNNKVMTSINTTIANLFSMQTIDDVDGMTTSYIIESGVENNTTNEPFTYFGDRKEEITETFENICSIHSFVVYGIICAFICIFGFAVNTLSCALLWGDRSQSATVFLILCLAIIDNLVLASYGLMLIWPSWSSYLQNGSTTLRYYPLFAAYFWPFCSQVQVMTSWFIVAVIFQRYIGICKPYLAKKYSSIKVAKIQSIAIVLGIAMFNFPRFLEYDIVTFFNNSTEQYTYNRVKSSIGSKRVFAILYKSVLYYLVSFMIPVCLLLWMTVSIILSLKKVSPHEGTGSNVTGTKEKVKREVTIVLVILAVIFMICQLCNPLRRILEIALPLELRACPYFYNFFANWSGAAVVLNSAVNFVIFLLCSKGFRKKLKIFCSKKSNTVDSMFTFSQAGEGIQTEDNAIETVS